MSDTQLVTIPKAGQVVTAEDFMPVFSVGQAIERKNVINGIIAGVMREGEDYGSMPGDTRKDKKKVLLKAGAEKLCSFFGLTAVYSKETVIEDWTGAEHAGEPLFYFEYRCQLWRADRLMGEGIGSANSWESKYRYRWIREDQLASFGYAPEADLMRRGNVRKVSEFDFALERRETTGQYGKPVEYWDRFAEAIHNGTAKRVQRETKRGAQQAWEMEIDETQYRIPNPDVGDIVNTLQKMAQKRALVAAVLVVTNCSDAFTQDLEDDSHPEPPIDTGGHPAGTQAAADHVRDTKLALARASQSSPGSTEGPTKAAAAQAASSEGSPASVVGAPTPSLHPTLAALFAAVDDTKPGNIKLAFDLAHKIMTEAMPENGDNTYHQILTERNIRKGSTRAECREAIAEMWALARWAREQAAKVEGGRTYEATDEDVPIEDEPASAGQEVSK